MEPTMRRVLFAAVAALPLTTISAGADTGASQEPTQAAPQCLEWRTAIVAAQAGNPDAALVKVMDGNQAGEFIEVVNSLPPVSTFEGNHVALFFKEKAEEFMVVIGQGDCARHVVEFPASVFARMVGRPA
jgi:hypothetical protein